MKLRYSVCPPAPATAVIVTLILAAGCRQEQATPTTQDRGALKEVVKTTVAAAPLSPPAPAGGFSGTVTETMDAGGYTYVQVDTGNEKVWAAGPSAKITVGSKVTIPEGTVMEDFHSKTLNRDFKVIHFVGAIGGAAAATGTAAILPPGHPPVTGAAGAAGAPEPVVTGIARVAGGQTVAEVYASKAELAGKSVKVRGKITKVNNEIMGKNWLHLRDGTGEVGTNDLTVTTAATVQKGDVVVVTGTVTADKDFGAGYKYSVLIEDAQVAVEAP